MKDEISTGYLEIKRKTGRSITTVKKAMWNRKNQKMNRYLKYENR